MADKSPHSYHFICLHIFYIYIYKYINDAQVMTADDTKTADPAQMPALNGTKTAGSTGSSLKSGLSHPLGPLSANEITQSSSLIKSQWPESTKFQFKILTLLEPPKAELVPYLAAEKSGETPKPIDRKSQVVYYLRNTVSCHDPIRKKSFMGLLTRLQDKLHEAVVNLTTSTVESNVRLGPFIHAPGDGEEIIAIENAMMEDEGVKAEIAKLQLPEGAVVVSDPWIYGMSQEAPLRFHSSNPPPPSARTIDIS